jgi:hypothetical protein
MAAKQKPTKLKEFFAGHRRKCFLVQWIQHCNRAGVSSIKMDMRFPLLTQSFMGMNTEINDQFSLMAKKDSKTGRSAINVEIEGMTLDIFSTDSSRERWVSTTGAKMMKLYLDTVGEGDKKEINLHMVVYVPYSIEMRDWASIHLHKDFYVESVYSNSESKLEFASPEEFEDEKPDESPASDDPDPAEDEPEDEDADLPFETPEPAAEVPARPKKSGPADLAAYHAAQMAKPN